MGDVLAVKEVSLKQGWYRGTNLSSGLTGVFPMSYALVKKSEGESFDVVINELVTVIREWGGILKMYYKVWTLSLIHLFSLIYYFAGKKDAGLSSYEGEALRAHAVAYPNLLVQIYSGIPPFHFIYIYFIFSDRRITIV